MGSSRDFLRLQTKFLLRRLGLTDRQSLRGASQLDDVRQDLRATAITTIFDVGANYGQSAVEFARAFPSAKITCFEPVRENFAQLLQNVARMPSIHCENVAVGASAATATMLLDERRDMCRIAAGAVPRGARTEQVQVEPIDGYCSRNGVDRISWLKIDTEGHDLEVLHGAAALLRGSRIDIVQVEASMNSGNARHVALARFQALLDPLGYQLFGVYDQTAEWTLQEPQLRRADLLFVSREVVEANRRA